MEKIGTVLRELITTPLYVIIASFIALAFGALMFLFPVFLIPGNDILFQASLYAWQDYALMISLALLIGINAALQTYVLRQNRASMVAKSTAETMGSGFSGMAASILGVTGVSCSSCLISLFTLFGMGTGGAYFILAHQTEFFLGSLALLVVLFGITLKRAVSGCSSCAIPTQ